MLDPGNARSASYGAFISYSRHDERIAAWLQTALERYRLPRDLIGQPTSVGPVPARLPRLFRDRFELTAGPDLSLALADALAASDALIVICTPAAAASQWVSREIEMFRQMGREDRILAALFDGDETTAFPAALLHAADGRTVTPLAADFREVGDGRKLGTMKLVAVLTGLKLDALVHRDHNRRVRSLTGAAAVLAGVAAAFALVAVTAIDAEARARREQAQSERMIEAMIGDLRGKLKPLGNLALLGDLNEAALGYFRGQTLADMPDSALAQRARLLIAMGEDDLNRGKLDVAQVQFSEAHRTTQARLASQPDDPERLFDHAQSEFWLGKAAWQAGDVAGARSGFEQYAKLAEALVVTDLTNADWQMEAGYAASNLGMLALRQEGKPLYAEARFAEALARFRVARAAGHGNSHDIDLQIADGLAWIADAQRADGRHTDAAQTRAEQLALLEKLLADNPGDKVARYRRLTSLLAIARLHSENASPEQSAERLKNVRLQASIEMLADPENMRWARLHRMAGLFEVRALLMMPSPRRPPLSAMDARIGDCDHSAPPSDLAETRMLCSMVRARIKAIAGDAEAAERLSRARVGEEVHSPLSAVWGIDFPAEREAVLAVAKGSTFDNMMPRKTQQRTSPGGAGHGRSQ